MRPSVQEEGRGVDNYWESVSKSVASLYQFSRKVLQRGASFQTHTLTHALAGCKILFQQQRCYWSLIGVCARSAGPGRWITAGNLSTIPLYVSLYKKSLWIFDPRFGLHFSIIHKLQCAKTPLLSACLSPLPLLFPPPPPTLPYLGNKKKLLECGSAA